MFSPPAWFSMNAERVRELADVVVVGRDAGDQRVGADRLGRALGEVPDHQRVVVRARRLDEQAPQQRLRRIRQLEQLEDGQDPEHRAQDGERADRGDAGPRRRGGRREPQLEDARARRASPSSENTDTTSALTTKTAIAAWTKTCSRSPLRIGDDAGHAAQERCRRRTRATSPFTAPPMIAMSAMTIVASDASSRIASSIPMAAVGRKNWRIDRPAVDLEGERRPDQRAGR